MYVIKTKEGAFVEEHSNGNELNFVYTTIENTKFYSQSDLKNLYIKFKDIFEEKQLQVFKINYVLERTYNWYFI